MRGHIGFKIPRMRPLRVTQVTHDVLTYDEPEPEARVTQLTTDVLTYDVAEAEPRVTQLTVDILTY